MVMAMMMMLVLVIMMLNIDDEDFDEDDEDDEDFDDGDNVDIAKVQMLLDIGHSFSLMPQSLLFNSLFCNDCEEDFGLDMFIIICIPLSTMIMKMIWIWGGGG